MQDTPITLSPNECRILHRLLLDVVGAEEPDLSLEEWQTIYDIMDRLRVHVRPRHDD